MYMAPEQARGEQVDHRADLFSLGSVIYAMCTGHSPFRASGTHAVLMRVIEDTPRPIGESNPELPDWLNDIILKLLAKKPDERFQTAKEVAELLEQHLAHVQQPHVAPRPPAVTVPAAVQDSVTMPPGKRMPRLLWWTIHVVVLSLALYGLYMLQHQLVIRGMPMSGHSPRLAPYWLVILGLTVYALGWTAWLVWRRWAGAVRADDPQIRESYASRTPVTTPRPLQILDETDSSIRIVQNIALAAAVILIALGTVFAVLNPGRWQVYAILNMGGGMACAAMAVVRQRWEVEYRGHAIRFENSGFGSELFIDNVKVAKSGMGLRRELRGVIPRGAAAGHQVKAIVEAGRVELRCRILVQPDSAPATARDDDWTKEEGEPVRARPRIGKRLAWMSASYLAVCIVLAISISAYSDMGWWSTPWIEFISAAVLLLLAVGHLFVRPRWFAPLPACLGLFAIALGTVLWPYSTGRHFARLAGEGRFEEANRLLGSGPWDYKKGELDIQVMINGPGVTLTRDDFPLQSWDSSFDHFAGQNDIDTFRFSLTSRAVQDRHCELKMAARYGKVTCEGVSFHRTVGLERRAIGAQEFARRHELGNGAPAELPTTADEVLPAMVGNWQVETTHKIMNGVKVGLQTAGKAHIELVAGKRYLRIRAQAGPDGKNFLMNYVQMFSFDPKTSDFRNTTFDASGLVIGPTTSRWDSRTHTLTGTSQPDASGIFIKNTRFIDANTMEWEAIVRDKTGKTVFDTFTKMTRTAGPAKISEEATLLPVSPEMAVLDRLVGDWKNESVVKTPDNPAGDKFSRLLRSRKILGGRMIASQESRPPEHDDSYWLATYDTAKKAYRTWYWDSQGNDIELVGQWENAAQLLRWNGEAPGGIRFEAVWKWKGPDRREWDFVTRDADGKPLAEIQGTSTRDAAAPVAKLPADAAETRKKNGDPNAPENVLSRYIGTWNVASEIQFPVPKTPEEARSSGVITSELVADGKFLRNYASPDRNGIEVMSVQSYDEMSRRFLAWHFFSDGGSQGPAEGTWDPAGQTLTWTEKVSSGELLVHKHTLFNADTIQSHLTSKKPGGEVTFELRNTYTRVKQTPAPKLLPLDPKRPQVLKNLDALTGFWRSDMIMKRVPEPDKPFRMVTDHHFRPILAGHFFEAHDDDSDRMAMRNYWIMGSSGSGKHYRFWHFNVAGGHTIYNGAWDETTKKVRWIATDGSTDGSWTMKTPTERAVEFTANDPQGKFLFHAKGNSKKRQTTIRKSFRPDHELLTADGVTPDRGGWRIDSKGPDTIRLFELQYPGVDDCIVTMKAIYGFFCASQRFHAAASSPRRCPVTRVSCSTTLARSGGGASSNKPTR